MTEEDIRGKLLLPYINDLGFDVSEISLEHAFTIRLGRNKHATGRSDILCKRNDKNLFVIELKNDSVSITPDDVDQGISYARLLDDIAPFMIISNGKETKIFDSISKEELSGKISEGSSFWRNGYSLSTEEDLKIRYEALKSFISLSPENLKVFCKSQVDDRMEGIVGNIDSPYAKFVQKLYVNRNDLQIAFESFILSDKSIFGVVGAAGIGKTNVMCSLALQKLQDTFVFFYNAAIINPPLDCIAQDLNMSFSGRIEPDIVLKKLDELGRFSNQNVLIFIDAIDESTNPNLALELSEIALVTKNLNRLKVILSCKANIWSSFLKIKNNPTHLYHQLNKVHESISALDNNPGYLLMDFTDEELNSILPLYQSEFGFKGTISKSLLNELKNGFFLKIFSEVYSGKPIPKKISDKELIKRYLEQSLEKTTVGFVLGIRTLSAIGNIIIRHSYDSWISFNDEGIDVEHILEKLDFSLDENIPEDLFTRNILIKSNSEGSYKVSFYYSKIRDYIICYNSYQLDRLNDDQFYDKLTDFYENHIGKSAIEFYLENASISHINTLVRYKKDKAYEFVSIYNRYLEENFSSFKVLFNPNTWEDIGILLPQDLINHKWYALFPLKRNSLNKLRFDDMENPMSASRDFFHENDIKVLFGNSDSIFARAQHKVAKAQIFDRLKEIIDEGKLNTYNSEILLLEQVATMLYFYHEKLNYHYEIKSRHLPRYEVIYPIDLVDLKGRLYKFLAFEHYKRSSINRSIIDKLVEEAVNKKIDLPKLNITGDFPPFEELYKIVDVLLSKGYDVIRDHYLPLPDKSLHEAIELEKLNVGYNFTPPLKVHYGSDQAEKYVESYFGCLETCYRQFIEDHFATFKDQLPFFRTMPHEYFLYTDNLEFIGDGWYGYRSSECGSVKINIKENSKNTIERAFKEDTVTTLKPFSLNNILRNNHFHRVKTVDKINTPRIDEHCVLRNGVYRLLQADFEHLFKKNGK